LNAGSLITQLGIEQANASQHLSVLRAKHIVSSRREGNQILYSVRDPRIIEVLDIMRRYFQSHLKQQMSALQEIRGQSSR
jgi:ArsR family transcriptional regulator